MTLLNLNDILHIKQVSLEVAVMEGQAEVADILTPQQLAKVAQVEILLEQVGGFSIDDELDATIAALTEIRDRP